MSDFKSVVKSLLENYHDPENNSPENQRIASEMKKNAGKTYAEIMADSLSRGAHFKGTQSDADRIVQAKKDEHADPAFQEHMKKLMANLKF